MAIRLVCLVEVIDASTVEDAVLAFEAFQAAILPAGYGITFSKAERKDVGRLFASHGGSQSTAEKRATAHRNGRRGGRPRKHKHRRGPLTTGRLVYWRDPDKGLCSGWGRIIDKRESGALVVSLKSGAVVEVRDEELTTRVSRRVLGPGEGSVTPRKRAKQKPKP